VSFPCDEFDFSQDEKKEREKHANTIDGKLIEYHLVEKLRDSLTNIKNTILINGWQRNSVNEFDIFILFKNQRTILHIEVKKSLSAYNVNHAASQLEEGFQMVLKHIPFDCLDKYTYRKVMYFETPYQNSKKLKNLMPCSACAINIFDPTTDFVSVFSTLESTQVFEAESKTDSYLSAIKFFLFTMYLQKDCITEKDILDSTMSMINSITDHKVLSFWTREQYILMNDENKKRVCLKTEFGSGKTTLLKAKAKQLCTAGEKVLLVVFSKEEKCLLIEQIKSEFSNLKGVTIICQKTSGSICFILSIIHHYEI